MAGLLEGKVSFITGAGRGQGRAHAVKQAAAGAKIVALDICRDIESNPYPMATEDDPAETVALVEAAGSECLGFVGDVRQPDQLREAVAKGVERFGRLTTVCANAGIMPMAMGDPNPMDFQDALEVDLVGVINTVSAALPHVLRAGREGSIIITGSIAALIPNTTAGTLDPRQIMGPGGAGYTLAKTSLVRYTEELSLHVAPYGVRANIVHPTNCNTHLLNSEGVYRSFRPDIEGEVTTEDFRPASEFFHALPVAWIEPEDVADLVFFLASDESKNITGTSIGVDAGCMIKWPNGAG
jgi:SDR family mycofactocin-dependent oxidoreductase